MRQVHKHPIPISTSKFSIMLQNRHKVLKVGVQDEKAFMWVEVVTDSEKSEIKFATYGTGQEIPDSAVYQDTYWIGPFVFHLYRL